MSDNIKLNVISKPSDINSYDAVPYESYPYEQSNPYQLMTLAKLFKMDPAPTLPERARVLELGCAGGGNLIPHAVHYPKAKFVGVDLSKVQIDEANKHKAALGLKNIEFHAISITDIDDSFGKFDYILCHGVFSWVPDFVRDKIFSICRDNLTENGIAYISYNTLPGWNMVRTVRDMMLYHANMFSSEKEKIAQARLLLEFVKDSFKDVSNNPYAESIKMEAALLSDKADHYLRHEHLEDNNQQYYFHEFMKAAGNCGLKYLADTSVSSMYLGNMPAGVAEKLRVIDDIVRTEQYMDFIKNRRFRCTLLCHDSVKLSRNINNEDITNFNMVFNLAAEKPLSEVDLHNNLEPLKFFYANNKESSMSTTSSYMKAILYSFVENANKPISFDKVAVSANKKLGGAKLTEIKNELTNNAMRLVLHGYMNISLQDYIEPNLAKPKTTKLAQYQVTLPQNWVTNLRHQAVGINIFEKFALRYMDGKNDKEKILELIMKHVENNELIMNKEGKKLEDLQMIKNELSAFFDATLTKVAASSLLL